MVLLTRVVNDYAAADWTGTALPYPRQVVSRPHCNSFQPTSIIILLSHDVLFNNKKSTIMSFRAGNLKDAQLPL